ncbi:MAG: homoserine dehydrogenase [Dehalococcoidales bacterium]|nr:homoserine dehydrogenase [Dehalococcoidales bacterium]
MTEARLTPPETKTATRKIAVIGFGNIGTGVVDLLYRKGINGLELVRVIDTDLERKRPVTLPPGYLSKDWRQAVTDPEIDIVVELIGGIEPARSILSTALENGKDVVTANKMLLAREGEHIFQLASTLQRRIGFRASFVGGHSLIHEFRQAGTANKKFRKIYAILNGTCNYILSTMSREDKGFEEALKEAQQKGYAESDPSDDIDGIDTANKIRIVLGLISNSYRTVKPFPVEGIRDITLQDIQYAAELGYSVKLVGVIEQDEGTFNVMVHPALVPRVSLLGSLEGPYNGIELEDEYGIISGLIAPGAGTYPTADAVIKDLLDIAEGRAMPMPKSAGSIVLGPPETIERRYYLRFSVLDQAGVLARICDIFWKHDISIAAVIQKEAVTEEFVPVVITTHLAKEGALQAAIEKVDRMDVVKARTKIIRILKADT